MINSDASRQEIELIEKHWVNSLSGELPVTMLPTFHPTEPAHSTESRGKLHIAVPDVIYRQLDAISNQSPMTVFMFWLSALNAVLYRYTAMNEFLTGTTFFQTEREYEEDHLMFIQGSISGNFSFNKLLDSMRRYALDSYKYQGFNFDNVYDQVKLKTGVAEPDIFHIAFISLAIQDATPSLDKFDFVIKLSADQRDLMIEYCTRFYHAETIQSFCANLFTFLENALMDRERKIDKIKLLSDGELELLQSFNRTERQFPHERMYRDIF